MGVLGLKNPSTGGDAIVVHQPFTTSTTDVTTAINGLFPSGGNGEPEISDEAVKYVATGATSCAAPSPPLGSFRTGCVKIAVLVTDATPAGCDDNYVDGVDDVNAQSAADAAAAAGIHISAILVDNGSITTPAHPGGVEEAVMMAYASTTGGVYTKIPGDGTGLSAAINDIIAKCGSASNKCPNSQGFWKTHPEAWPIDKLVIGGTSYTKAQLLQVLNTPVRGNAVLILAYQLIAAELNIASGSDPTVISAARATAHALLTSVNLLTGSVRTNTSTGHSMTSTADTIDHYNNRLLTPDCNLM